MVGGHGNGVGGGKKVSDRIAKRFGPPRARKKNKAMEYLFVGS